MKHILDRPHNVSRVLRKLKNLLLHPFLQFKWSAIAFSLSVGFYSCKHLRKIIFLAPEFPQGTDNASQVRTSLIEKTPAASRTLWHSRGLAGNTMQQMQRNSKNH